MLGLGLESGEGYGLEGRVTRGRCPRSCPFIPAPPPSFSPFPLSSSASSFLRHPPERDGMDGVLCVCVEGMYTGLAVG